MLKATCQLNLTLEVPDAEHVVKIARESSRNYRPSGAGRILLQQRLALEAAGWKIDDKDMEVLLEALVRLKPDEMEAVKDLLRRLVIRSPNDDPRIAVSQ